MHRLSIILIYYIAGVLRICNALPIPSTIGDRNTFLVGIMGLLGVGAILGACVCCRRKKRGFELNPIKDRKEFENESGTTESIRTEFPIFRALSSTQQPNTYRDPSADDHIPISNNIISINQNIINNVQQEFDNNNGPISSADMENIENNNAVDYIPNRNEIGVVVEPRFTINRNLTAINVTSSPLHNQDIALNIEPIEPNFSQNVSVQQESTPSNEIDYNLTNPFHAVDINEVSITIEDPKEINRNHVDTATHSSNGTAMNPFIFAENQLTIDALIQNRIDELAGAAAVITAIKEPINIDTNRLISENVSETSSLSDKSNLDVNSVEEALRALDFAISGGEDSLLTYDDDDDEDDYDVENDDDNLNKNECINDDIIDELKNPMDTDSNDFHNVLRQFLINNGATLHETAFAIEKDSTFSNNKVPNTTIVSQINNDDNDNDNVDQYDKKILLENVQKEAKKLVDSIVDECEMILNKRNSEINQNSYVKNITTTNAKYSLNNDVDSLIIDDEQKHFFLDTENNLANQTIIITKSDTENVLKNDKVNLELNENEFFDDLNMTSSTPLIVHKFAQRSADNDNDNQLFDQKSAKQNIFAKFMNNEENDDSYNAVIAKGMAIINNDTFDSFSVNDKIVSQPTENVEKKLLNETFDCNNTFVKNSTFNRTEIIDKTFNKNDTFNADSPTTECNDTFVKNSTFTRTDATFNADSSATVVECDNKKLNCPTIRIDKDEMLSADLSTVTPVNTPIELNYAIDSWDKFMSNTRPNDCEIDLNQPCTSAQAAAASSSGWFLHPQQQQQSILSTPSACVNSTYDKLEDGDEDDDDDEDYDNDDRNEANLNLTFDALRKQLAEALPHAQGIAGPPEFTDYYEEDDLDQRSPLSSNEEIVPQTEMVINYKRPLSPIMEESEDETCKTFVMNETKLLDSTSTGCIETGEAIMGVTKTLMASNDTLFNFEDTLGDRDDMFSPRTPSQTDSAAHSAFSSGRSDQRTPVNDPQSSTTLDTTDVTSFGGIMPTESSVSSDIVKASFKPMEFNTVDIVSVADLLSPDQQKTFSDETITTIEHVSSDLSAGTCGDVTFTTTNTGEEKTCISVNKIVAKNAADDNDDDDDERLSEISEPEWGAGSTTTSAASNLYDMNTFADVPSLDMFSQQTFTTANSASNSNSSTTTIEKDKISSIEQLPNNMQPQKQQNDKEINETTAIIDDDNESHLNDNTVLLEKHNDQLTLNLCSRENVEQFLHNEIDFSSIPVQMQHIKTTSSTTVTPASSSQCSQLDSISNTKENSDPNVPLQQPQQQINDEINQSTNLDKNLSDNVILEKDFLSNPPDLIAEFSPGYGTHPSEEEEDENIAESELNGQSEQNCLTNSDDALGQLSGEEDPWAHPIADIRFSGPSTEIMSTSFTANEWDSDVDDSNSSEEFMYVKGTPPQVPSPDLYKQQMEHKNVGRQSPKQTILEEDDMDDVWNSHKDKIPVTCNEEPTADDSEDDNNSDVEDEWVPSSWDSMAQPARSALKSPDKTSSEEDLIDNPKKRRSVAFKKQNYHSVYEYPKEAVSLSPSYSEPHLWERDLDNLRFDTITTEGDANNLDGFTVSSSARPFHGTQFNIQCHTWPTDTEFSWSQVQNDEEHNDKFATYSDLEIKWPKNLGDFSCSEETKEKIDCDLIRPDSGVGESAEILTESISLGDLCHTKSSLRLPLKLTDPIQCADDDELIPVSVNAFRDVKQNHSIITSTTPSCTGSMDSLSSSSGGSDRQVSFTTFGKTINSLLVDDKNHLNDTGGGGDINRPPLVLIENENILDIVDCSTIIKNNHKKYEQSAIIGTTTITANKQNDSTDEDSGIESIMRIAKENV